MLKPTVKRGLMLDFIPGEIYCSEQINPKRIFKLNDKDIVSGDIVYVMCRELRLEDNWAIVFGFELAKKRNQKFRIIVNLPDFSEVQRPFIDVGLNFLMKNSVQNNIDLSVSSEIPKNAGAVIFDFNPIEKPDKNAFIENTLPPCFEVDSHNIVPARYVSDKQEFSAATLRRKIYANIAEFLTEYPKYFEIEKSNAENKLEEFINYKLDSYNEFKNDPNQDVTSGMSQYLHFGFISSQRIALEILKSNASRANKEAFLEELIVRKELSDNFCLYAPDYKSFDGVPNWSKETLSAHINDFKPYIYTFDEFKDAQTHDKLWNKIQHNLLKTGRIHGYLRMYWAKKILEWAKNPTEALRIAIKLNDDYAIDGRDPNGYVGILWSLGGLHDRAFSNRPITGKIRYFSENSLRKKFDVARYVKTFALIAILIFNSSKAFSQQTIFNVPSADVTPKGNIFLQEEAQTTPWFAPNALLNTNYAAVGIGHNTEIDATLFNVASPATQNITLAAGFKSAIPIPYLDKKFPAREFKFTIGSDMLFGLEGNGVGNWTYAHISGRVPKLNTRLTAGVSYGGRQIFGINATSFIAGVEQPVTKKLTLIGDWYSGQDHFAGYLITGFSYALPEQTTLYVGFQIPNHPNVGAPGFVIELAKILKL